MGLDFKQSRARPDDYDKQTAILLAADMEVLAAKNKPLEFC